MAEVEVFEHTFSLATYYDIVLNHIIKPIDCRAVLTGDEGAISPFGLGLSIYDKAIKVYLSWSENNQKFISTLPLISKKLSSPLIDCI